ncbi:homeobox-leucine zipper protein HDG8-like, partial [Trifolium medium]|nr:homeobox-leucine zipper protein HDG8-like [Trifolium medium]
MMENSNFLQPQIPKFDGHYDHWAMLMENLLRSKEYWLLIEVAVTKTQQATTASKLRDLK